jgi:hypothetical protein
MGQCSRCTIANGNRFFCWIEEEKNRRPSTSHPFHLKNRKSDLCFPVKLLHMKRRVFHWLLAAALAASLPLTAQSVAGRGMGVFAGGGSHFSSGARFGNRPDFAHGPGFSRAFAFRHHDGRFRDHDRFFHHRFSRDRERDRFFFGYGYPYPRTPLREKLGPHSQVSATL